ncbi:2OG-Fe(II) oxygenase [Vandammella animalimorsus]|uniref:2OG-Fe(II) oxygenase n=1 Tax=Vandammella animalimorsus TaxID=2029117 RepID=A0A2A2T3I4_9BURK|nr:alpha-ketoglutarate-dependent dioxygenase AlkB [Vandammella animalimorsus]PAT32476.1 2OG-Fe(II) oxygenase [Vandammella animalimorsus]PAX16045.1 2OG-Fe(II) oxygenase [Vandammella animalimorsus]PAX20260.1 2OG-Fe(II) oxygenase [Vandammella animalimorsus]
MNTLDLFASAPEPAANLLPCDGIVNDYGLLYSAVEADQLLQLLLTQISWRHDEAVIYGKRIVTARQVAWYGDAAFDYRYSGATRTALPWTDALLAIKARVEAAIAPISPTRFNSCLLNLYADGSQGMAWHSDDEAELGPQTVIASLSLGATRKFALRHRRSGEKRELLLQHGQLIVMRGATQTHWQHALMKSTRVHAPRVNLTFRTFRSLSSSS